MQDKYKTEQEQFWADPEWGKAYIERNKPQLIKNNTALFSKIFRSCKKIESVIEFGSSVGLNLHAINRLLEDVEISALDINAQAITELKTLNFVKNVYHESFLDFKTDYQRDLVIIKGALIHTNPQYLNTIYQKLYETSKKYILIAEYYNPTPVSVIYRGEKDKLFRRDFAGEVLDKYQDLQLVDYGFCYHRDNNFPQDDITWFLLEK